MVDDENDGERVTAFAEMIFEASLCSNAVRPVRVETVALPATPLIEIFLLVAREDPFNAGSVIPAVHPGL
ncbi:unannotated protein [freshwater metagenome]|uniref:Unannotated protein n=1 Tax=freshwater metagenome TaxID=449393 RepID=A0A6J7PN18_9ZZZZ